MNLERAFPKCNARIYATKNAVNGDLFVTARVGGNRLSLAAPLSAMHYPPPVIGATVYVTSLRPDAAYQTAACVIKTSSTGDWLCVVLEQHGDIERVQRRRSFRVLVSMPVQITDLEAEHAQPMESMTLDVGADGMCVVADSPIAEGRRIRVSLDLHDGSPPVTSTGVIVRRRRLASGEYEHGICFEALGEGDVERMIRVLMTTAREQLNV